MPKPTQAMSPEEQQIRRRLTSLAHSHSSGLNSVWFTAKGPRADLHRAKVEKIKKEKAKLRKQLARLEKEKAKADDPLRSTKAVLNHHLEAFDSGDMDAILSDYAKDAVLLTPEGVFKGHSQIRPILQKLLDDIFSTATEFKMVQQIVKGDVAFIVWSAKSKKASVPLGTDTYVVRFGKIVTQTFAADGAMGR